MLWQDDNNGPSAAQHPPPRIPSLMGTSIELNALLLPRPCLHRIGFVHKSNPDYCRTLSDSAGRRGARVTPSRRWQDSTLTQIALSTGWLGTCGRRMECLLREATIVSSPAIHSTDRNDRFPKIRVVITSQVILNNTRRKLTDLQAANPSRGHCRYVGWYVDIAKQGHRVEPRDLRCLGSTPWRTTPTS